MDQPLFLQTNPDDNVVIVVRSLEPGTELFDGVSTRQSHRLGQKLALRPIATGEPILRYGAPIGLATVDIEAGELVHDHNVASSYLRATTYRGEQP